MPKSKRTKTYHLTQVTKKTREQKEQLFQNIRETVPNYKYCFALGFDNMRNNHLKEVRHEMSDSRYVRFLYPNHDGRTLCKGVDKQDAKQQVTQVITISR